jgi:hypothetical protein
MRVFDTRLRFTAKKIRVGQFYVFYSKRFFGIKLQNVGYFTVLRALWNLGSSTCQLPNLNGWVHQMRFPNCA